MILEVGYLFYFQAHSPFSCSLHTFETDWVILPPLPPPHPAKFQVVCLFSCWISNCLFWIIFITLIGIPIPKLLMTIFSYNYLNILIMCCAKSLQSCPTLWDPMDCSLPGSSVHGILQVRTLEWVAISSSGDLPDPVIEPGSLTSLALAGRFFTAS